jgi:hypothetical protein
MTLYCFIFCRNKDPHLPFGGHRVTLSRLSSSTMIQVAIVKPTILSVCICAIIVHILVVIDDSIYLWNCLIISILFANSNKTMYIFVIKLMSLQWPIYNYFYDELVIKYVTKILPNHSTPRGPIKRGHVVESNLATCHLKIQCQQPQHLSCQLPRHLPAWHTAGNDEK